MITETSQNRHEKLIDFLNQFQQYQINGRGRLKKVKEQRTSDKFKDIDSNDINLAVVLILDMLNLSGGSVGDVNLYKLLQVYFLVPEYRGKFNLLVKEARAHDYDSV